MTKTKLHTPSLLLTMCMAALLGCNTAVDPGDLPVAESSQELARCGLGNTCAAGWTCADRLDGACHPQCTFVVADARKPSGGTVPGGICRAPFSSWSCCLGYVRPDGSVAQPYCAITCP